MESLTAGQYTGDVIHRLSFEDVFITNTLYSDQESNPNWHYHENLHLCFVFQKGKADTRRATTYTAKGGSIFFYHAEEEHRWIAPNPISKSTNVEIGRSFLTQYGINELEIKAAIEQKVDAKALMLRIQKESLSGEIDRFTNIQALLLELITFPMPQRDGGIPRWVIGLKALLHDNWNQELSLAEIAQIIQVHPVTISKHFRKYFHCTLGTYRRKLKVEHSINFIKHTTKSLSEIAYDCGFADQSHFTRNFKALTGFLPNAFRKL
ncbi:MAG: AraC family transcriptional regulator [Bacteroidota bacterium]